MIKRKLIKVKEFIKKLEKLNPEAELFYEYDSWAQGIVKSEIKIYKRWKQGNVTINGKDKYYLIVF